MDMRMSTVGYGFGGMCRAAGILVGQILAIAFCTLAARCCTVARAVLLPLQPSRRVADGRHGHLRRPERPPAVRGPRLLDLDVLLALRRAAEPAAAAQDVEVDPEQHGEHRADRRAQQPDSVDERAKLRDALVVTQPQRLGDADARADSSSEVNHHLLLAPPPREAGSRRGLEVQAPTPRPDLPALDELREQLPDHR